MKKVSLLIIFSILSLYSVAQQSQSFSFSGKNAMYDGTLTYPIGRSSCNAVILVSGMGLQDRNWSFANGKYLMGKNIADSLVKAGYAVLQYDDRGFGKSTGTPETLTSFDELSDDIFSAYLELKKQKGIKKVGLLGHSLGGLLSVMTASRHSEIDFIITLSGSFRTGESIMNEQATTLKRWRTSKSMSEDDVVNQGKKFVQYWVSHSNGNEGFKEMKEILSSLINFQIETMSEKDLKNNLNEYGSIEEMRRKETEAVIAFYDSPHQKSFAVYAPIIDFQKVKCPILILFGEKDGHVVTQSNLEEISKVLPKCQWNKLSICIIPNVDHGYTTKAFFEKGQIYPGLCTTIENWLKSI